MPLRADISHLHHHFSGDLLLDIQIVILHVGGLDIPVEREHIAFNTAATRRTVNRYAGCNRARNTRRDNRERTDIVVRWPGIEERRVRQMSQKEILRKRIVEHPESAT